MSEKIIILGAGVMQGPAIRIAKEMGLFTVVVDADPHAPHVDMADRFEQIDLKDKEGIEALARSLQAIGGLAGIMTAGTDFSASVAWVAERLGLPGIPYEAALNASDKQRMRACFDASRVPSPAFTIMSADATAAAPPPFPVVVKPVDNMGSRGCRRVDSHDEMAEAVADALRFSRSGRAIVESFMEGPEFSVDAIVYDDDVSICGLADRHIFFPPYFIEMGHTMPTRFSLKDQEALLETFKAAVRALGIAGKGCRGAAKGDIKLTPSGPMIGEVAARLSGGYMSGWTYPYASGVQPIRGAIQVCQGIRPDGLSPSRSWTCAERAFISIPGRVRSLHGVEQAKGMGGVRDLFLRAEAGTEVRFPDNNVSKCGNFIVSASGREEAVQAAEGAVRAILVRLEAHNEATDAFLAAAQGGQTGGQTPAFPPNAFTLGPELLSALARLPDPSSPHALPAASIIPFPSFTGSGLRDYVGRSVEASLDAVRELTGLALPLVSGNFTLGRGFWTAFIRGGYQGAAYFLDNLNVPGNKRS
jgi:biotin carboxylase